MNPVTMEQYTTNIFANEKILLINFRDFAQIAKMQNLNLTKFSRYKYDSLM